MILSIMIKILQTLKIIKKNLLNSKKIVCFIFILKNIFSYNEVFILLEFFLNFKICLKKYCLIK